MSCAPRHSDCSNALMLSSSITTESFCLISSCLSACASLTPSFNLLLVYHNCLPFQESLTLPGSGASLSLSLSLSRLMTPQTYCSRDKQLTRQGETNTERANKTSGPTRDSVSRRRRRRRRSGKKRPTKRVARLTSRIDGQLLFSPDSI